MDEDDRVTVDHVSLYQLDLHAATEEMDLDATADPVERAHKEWNDQRKLVQQTRAAIVPVSLEIKNLKDEKYALNKFARDKRSLPIPSTSPTKSKGKKKMVATTPSKSASSASTGASTTTSEASSFKSSKPTHTSMPSVMRPGSMDYVEATCIKQLRKDIEENNRTSPRKITLVPGGTDPGAKTLFETVVVPETTLIKHQNRFQLLSEDLADPPDAIADQADFDEALKVSRTDALAKIKIPETHKTTVAHIRHLSGLRQQAKSRKRALEKNPHIGSLYTELGKSSPYRANTVAEVKKAATDRRNAREEVHAFEYSKSMTRRSRNTARRLERTYDHVASKERQAFKKLGEASSIVTPLPQTQIQSNGFCPSCKTHHRPELTVDPLNPTRKRLVLKHLRNCPRSLPKVIPLFLHGAAGMGVGSRLKGNARMGGNKIPQKHMHHCPVCKTNEHNSSKTCPFCFKPTRLVRARRMRDGKEKLVRLNGAVECTNAQCISYRCGYTIRGRDNNAAFNIAVAGYTQLTSADRTTLPPFTTSTKRPWSRPLPSTGSSATGNNFPMPSTTRCADELNLV